MAIKRISINWEKIEELAPASYSTALEEIPSLVAAATDVNDIRAYDLAILKIVDWLNKQKITINISSKDHSLSRGRSIRQWKWSVSDRNRGQHSLDSFSNQIEAIISVIPKGFIAIDKGVGSIGGR